MASQIHVTLARLARGRFGIITRGELIDAEIASSTISRLVRDGLLVVVYRGVYRVASVAASAQGDLLAAVKAVSGDAVASHDSATASWNLGDTRLVPPYHVTSPQRCQKQLDRVIVHLSEIDRIDRTTLGPTPITMVPRTVIDHAGGLTAQADVDDLVIEGLRSRRATRASYLETLARVGPVPGAGRVRRTLERFDAENAARLASRMETGFLRVFVDGGIPPTSINQRIEEHDGLFIAKTDAGWEPPGVHVECDSVRFHATMTQKRYDDARQNRLVLSDRIVLRYCYEDLADPERIVREVRQALDLAWSRL